MNNNHYLSVKATLNKCVFRRDYVFHKVDFATLNADSLYILSQNIGVCAIISDWMTVGFVIKFLMDDSSHTHPVVM